MMIKTGSSFKKLIEEDGVASNLATGNHKENLEDEVNAMIKTHTQAESVSIKQDNLLNEAELQVMAQTGSSFLRQELDNEVQLAQVKEAAESKHKKVMVKQDSDNLIETLQRAMTERRESFKVGNIPNQNVNLNISNLLP